MSLILFGCLLPWCLLALGGWLAYQLLRQNGRMLLRVEALEQHLLQLTHALAARPAAGCGDEPDAPSGLPVGSEAPEHHLLEQLAAMERQNRALDQRLRRAERRIRVQLVAAALAVVGAILISPTNRAAIAQGPGSSLAQRVQNLEPAVAALRTTVNGHTTQIGALQTKTQFISVSSGEMFLVGTNLRIVNGLGRTDTTNGLGNLIVGYNELRSFGNARGGSHNVVVGSQHNFTRYGGLVVGLLNTISGPFASVSGGQINTADGVAASVSGGQSNTADGGAASVSGGNTRTALGEDDWVAGGLFQSF
jgi:hypothetical protein